MSKTGREKSVGPVASVTGDGCGTNGDSTWTAPFAIILSVERRWARPRGFRVTAERRREAADGWIAARWPVAAVGSATVGAA